jgi:60 kDa SS-A/Ro ribonucleoprotein
MSKALRAVNIHETPQMQRANDRQVQNNAGGYVYKTSDKQRLERFLILGVDGGTYYVKQKDLTQQNVDFVRQMLRNDARLVVDTVVDVSTNARAKSNSPALFVLALAMNTNGIDKAYVRAAVQKVARTFTHLAEYAQYLENLGGWGRAKRQSIAEWYTDKSVPALANQLVKYRQRDGWTHRDMLRLSHPVGLDSNLVAFALDGVLPGVSETDNYRLIVGYQKAQVAQTEKEVVTLVKEYRLPWEAVPTQWHKSLKVWQALFEVGMGQTALVRNVTRYAKLGAFNDVVFAKEYADRLQDADAIVKGRLHPINYLNAAVVYEEGQADRNSGWSLRRNKSWQTNSKVLSALNNGFDLSFKNVEPSNKRTLVAVDTSGSMWWGTGAGLELSHAQIAAAVGIFVARTEPYSEFRAFSFNLVNVGITENDSLATVVKKMAAKGGGGTNCAAPMEHALKTKGADFDTFVVITDNETWAGSRHPDQALRRYRQHIGHDAKLAVLATEATPFTIADPNDPGMMDFVGFDSNAPRVLADFSAGRL